MKSSKVGIEMPCVVAGGGIARLSSNLQVVVVVDATRVGDGAKKTD